jgi:hypothetical protein
MVIKCCFGVLKNHFHILRGMPRYKVCCQPLIVNAYCILHNFICQIDRDDAFFEHAQPIVLGDTAAYPNEYDFSNEAALAMANTRDEIAQLMWNSIHPPN